MFHGGPEPLRSIRDLYSSIRSYTIFDEKILNSDGRRRQRKESEQAPSVSCRAVLSAKQIRVASRKIDGAFWARADRASSKPGTLDS